MARTIVVALAMMAAPATAQDDAVAAPPDDAMNAAAQDSEIDRFGGGPSELDILSRRADDPFPQISAAEKRIPVSVTLRALDKITARYKDIEAAMNEVAKFGTLEIVPRYCDKRPPEEFPETTAFLQIFDRGNKPKTMHLAGGEISGAVETNAAETGVTQSGAAKTGETPLHADTLTLNAELADLLDVEILGENIFHGWMFSSSPALNPLEHAVYDVWVIDCKTAVTDS